MVCRPLLTKQRLELPSLTHKLYAKPIPHYSQNNLDPRPSFSTHHKTKSPAQTIFLLFFFFLFFIKKATEPATTPISNSQQWGVASTFHEVCGSGDEEIILDRKLVSYVLLIENYGLRVSMTGDKCREEIYILWSEHEWLGVHRIGRMACGG